MNEVPVISSNTGGIPEVNFHGETGYLSPVGAVDEMAENAISILKDSETLDRFKKKAALMAQDFDLLKILPLYEEVYEKAYASRVAL
mgnify:FL=1